MRAILLGAACFLAGALFGIALTAILQANHYDERDGRP